MKRDNGTQCVWDRDKNRVNGWKEQKVHRLASYAYKIHYGSFVELLINFPCSFWLTFQLLHSINITELYSFWEFNIWCWSVVLFCLRFASNFVSACWHVHWCESVCPCVCVSVYTCVNVLNVFFFKWVLFDKILTKFRANLLRFRVNNIEIQWRKIRLCVCFEC